MTFLHADVVDWVSVIRVLGDDEAGAAALRFQEIVVEVVRAEGGYEREVWGDKVFAMFDRPLGAVRAAVRARERLRDADWIPGGDTPTVRWGIHSGRMGASPTGHIGSAWVRCVELCMSAEPGQILVSESTEALLEGEVLDVTLRDLGERKLHDVDRPMHVYELDP